MGEPAGIGGEIALAAWSAREAEALPAFVMLDDPERLRRLAARIGLAVPVAPVERAEDAAAAFGRALPVLPVPLDAPAVPGLPDPANAPAVLASIDRAVALVREGRASALVTNPIQKSVLYRAGFRHPGHTEYLAHLAGVGEAPAMMLEARGLRVVLVTIHLPLREAVAALSTAGIIRCGRVALTALAGDFGIARPRLAVAALNPHAGEDGTLGREEIEVIRPAVDALRAEGHAVEGPLPADTLFHEEARRRYDAVLCMYHDQGLIPLKTIDFDGGVNITLGLPFVRTSPDHGTALALAGTGRASARSLIGALRSAARIAERRAARSAGWRAAE